MGRQLVISDGVCLSSRLVGSSARRIASSGSFPSLAWQNNANVAAIELRPADRKRGRTVSSFAAFPAQAGCFCVGDVNGDKQKRRGGQPVAPSVIARAQSFNPTKFACRTWFVDLSSISLARSLVRHSNDLGDDCSRIISGFFSIQRNQIKI